MRLQLRPSAKIRLCWFVCFTFLLAALMPLLSHLALAQNSAAWTEVCTATGAKFVRVDMAGTDGGTSRDAPATAKAGMDCSYCHLHSSLPLLPPPALQWQPPNALKFELPRLFLHAPRPLFAWAPSQARAPPALS